MITSCPIVRCPIFYVQFYFRPTMSIFVTQYKRHFLGSESQCERCLQHAVPDSCKQGRGKLLDEREFSLTKKTRQFLGGI